MIEFLLHFLTPRSSNNHKAKALQLSSLAVYFFFLILFQVSTNWVSAVRPDILGYASNITVNELLTETNQRRLQAGLNSLVLNNQLTQAAQAKGQDMFANQYWAHVSPTGRQPWYFITNAGYNFLFAGENLARDFGDSKSVVDAWMNSPTHKENLLSPKYQDIGFAIVNGKYADHETTLVVQMFGTRAQLSTVNSPETPSPSQIPFKVAPATATPSSPTIVNTTPSGMVLNIVPQTPPVNPKINLLLLTKLVTSGLAIFLISVLLIDGLLIYRRKIVRLSGHNFAHIIIFLALLLAYNLISRGTII